MSTQRVQEGGTAVPPSEGEVGYLIADPTRGLSKALGLPEWGTLDVDSIEHVAALKWPHSVVTFDRMRSDPQIDALLRGMFQPIRRFRWSIDPDGAKKGVSNALAEDMGLPVIGQKKGSRPYKRNRFKHGEHLRTALLAHVYGHMMFEMDGTIEAGPGGRLMWRLRKLAPRMPHSISEIKVARDGGLEWIKQKDEWEAEPIGIERLLVFVHDKEGANWFGR